MKKNLRKVFAVSMAGAYGRQDAFRLWQTRQLLPQIGSHLQKP